MDRRNRVEKLFHEALALEPSARTHFLAEACATEPDLLEEVTQLISAFEQRGSFIDTPAYEGIDLDDDLSDSLIGTSISHYRVIRLIKKSGMGEVYLARDTHLPRDVALKLLPLMFTGDENRLRRFTLEAESASLLNHPNILTIYEIGHIQDLHYIATEFVDGQTLRERLADGPLELGEALEIAIGVANALVASHAAGIVHRDIKPENIMIRRDGYVKVLDFGLAKLTEQPDVRIERDSQRLSRMDTEPGTFMGTVGYLSPEQAQSLEVDTRSDIFSLGVVIYEMIAGQNPFNREAFNEVIDAIAKTEPVPLVEFAPHAPAALQKIVSKALSKDKEGRYQQTNDLLTDLKSAQAQIQQQALPRTRRDRARRVAIGLAAILVVALFGAIILKVLNRNRSGISELPARLRFSEIHSWRSERGEGAIEARISHDGRMIAFTMLKNQLEGIWVKEAVSGAEPRLIISDPNELNWPIWSPDDQQIAFYSYRGDKVGIWSSPVNGGPPRFLGSISGRNVRLKSWSQDGRTIYYDSANNLFGFDVATGVITQLTSFERQPAYRAFSLAPTEDRIAYVGVHNGQTDIWVASLNGDAALQVTNDLEIDRAPLWHPDGKRIVYTSNRGGAFQVSVAYLDGSKPTQVTVGAEDQVILDISRDGMKLLNVISRDNAEIFAVDTESGRESELTSGSGLMLWPQVSPDGQLLTFQSANAVDKITSSTIFVKRPTGEGPMTAVAADGFGPTWSPDGRQILFLRFTGGQPDLYSVSSAGENERRLTTGGVGMNGLYLLPATKYGRNFCWSHKGNAIVYTSRASGLSDLWTMGLDGSQSKPLSANTNPNQSVFEPVCGPDGRIAFAVDNRQGSSPVWSLWVKENGVTKRLLETKSVLRPIGWLDQGNDLVAAYSEEEGPIIQGYPVPVKLIRISRAGRIHPIGTLASTYFWTIQLSADNQSVAFISDQDKSDNIWLMAVSDGRLRKLTSNNEPKVFFCNLNWSSDGKTIYFGKQNSIGLITMIDNFE